LWAFRGVSIIQGACMPITNGSGRQGAIEQYYLLGMGLPA
jgi:hypothetical protein